MNHNDIKSGLILSSEDFKQAIWNNIFSMNLDNVFHISEGYITQLFCQWEFSRFKDDYRAYVSMIYNLPDGLTFVDTDLLLFKLTRRLADELIQNLAESYYYDTNSTVIGEQLIVTPFKSKSDITDYELLYFLDLIDEVYDRNEIGKTTVDILRMTFRDDMYMNVFAREPHRKIF